MPIFVGRTAELAMLRARHAEAEGGQPRTVILEGPPGVGKTALVQAFLAELDKGSVLTASGDEAESFLRWILVTKFADAKRVRMSLPGRACARLSARAKHSSARK